ncbi:MAG: alanine dehydrogenase [Chloroflexi bacterium]|jgi:alanine dehydrogenase|nr:alanine dehydrogenase [Chloroflexota bacterium]MBT3669845.1 alanine dehydrogenase [Chloroflexota bacterium]MBT4002857.1 alanine dehydrogenase [Chloroflexota bacterium]MBT4304746.1 alanine dehydrogenase [Chloroflexota bacterium]MBT4534752.1 alanine dehydrogenase [Chloroflexota bacterium]
MNIGIPKESRPSEYRVGLHPAGVKMLISRGNTCYIEHDAGLHSGFTDQDYEKVGGTIVYSAHEAFGRADLILKFSRPLENELRMISPNATLCGFLHLPAANQTKIDFLLENEITTIAYEQIQEKDGSRPVLHMMSEIGGRLSAQISAHYLQNNSGGKGILLGGSAGVPPAEVVIFGAGVFGHFAASAFLGMGAQVTVLDRDYKSLRKIQYDLPQLVTMFSNQANIERTTAYADVVIAAAGIPGELAPKIITREILKSMKSRALIMDISIDQGGCAVTSRPTTHDNPIFVEEDVIHYCVPNISSVIARTATNAFFNVAVPYILDLAEKDVDKAIQENTAIEKAVNTYKGKIVNLNRIIPQDK